MAMTDPHNGLLSFQQALDEGIIKPTRCNLHPDLAVLQDSADGVPRLTYALIENGLVKATVVGVMAEPIEGTPCFALGYAVAEQFRNKGLAKEVLQKVIEEISNGFKKHMKEVYIETIVGADNTASQKLSVRFISDSPKSITDVYSGLPAFQYVKLLKL